MAMVKRAKGRCDHVATDVAAWWRSRHRLFHRQQTTGRDAAERGRVVLRISSAARHSDCGSFRSPGLCCPYPISVVSKVCPITNALSIRECSRMELYRHIVFSLHPASCGRNRKTHGVYRSELRGISDPQLVGTMVLGVGVSPQRKRDRIASRDIYLRIEKWCAW